VTVEVPALAAGKQVMTAAAIANIRTKAIDSVFVLFIDFCIFSLFSFQFYARTMIEWNIYLSFIPFKPKEKRPQTHSSNPSFSHTLQEIED
jgi:hypothetical protein